MKRTVSVLLAGLLMVMWLTACESKNSSADSEESASENAGSVQESENGGTPEGNPPGEPPGDFPGGNPPDGMPGGQPGNGGADIVYTAAVEILSADSQDGQIYESSEADQSALLISTADDVFINNPTVNKSGDSDGGDNCNFYGLNAAVLVKDGSAATISGGAVMSDASGANGVFCSGGNGGQNGASGDGTALTIHDTVITTTA